jgi:hypothetical protein
MELFRQGIVGPIATGFDVNRNLGNFAAEIQFTATASTPHFVRLFDMDGFFGSGTSFEFSITALNGADPLDANLDGVVDILDLLEVGAHWRGPHPVFRSEKPGQGMTMDEELLLDLLDVLRR